MEKKVRASVAMLAVTGAAAIAMAVAPGVERMYQPREQTAHVRTCTVQAGCVEQLIMAAGTVRYDKEYALLSPVTGRVAQVYVQAGQHVAAGQVIARLDTAVQEEAVSAALAAQQDVSVLASALPAEMNVETVAQLQSGTEAAQAAQLLRSMILRAPAEGLVQQVNAAEMGGVMAGSPVAALSGEEQVILCSMVTKDAQQLQAGMQARVLQEGLLVTTATVAEIGPAQVSQETGQTLAQVRLIPQESIDQPLGAQVDVEILLRGQENVPVVPVEAVTDADTLWWVADGRCWEIPAQAVMADDTSCWVNLPEGTRVVLDTQGLIQGQRVREMSP